RGVRACEATPPPIPLPEAERGSRGLSPPLRFGEGGGGGGVLSPPVSRASRGVPRATEPGRGSGRHRRPPAWCPARQPPPPPAAPGHHAPRTPATLSDGTRCATTPGPG